MLKEINRDQRKDKRSFQSTKYVDSEHPAIRLF